MAVFTKFSQEENDPQEKRNTRITTNKNLII